MKKRHENRNAVKMMIKRRCMCHCWSSTVFLPHDHICYRYSHLAFACTLSTTTIIQPDCLSLLEDRGSFVSVVSYIHHTSAVAHKLFCPPDILSTTCALPFLWNCVCASWKKSVPILLYLVHPSLLAIRSSQQLWSSALHVFTTVTTGEYHFVFNVKSPLLLPLSRFS